VQHKATRVQVILCRRGSKEYVATCVIWAPTGAVCSWCNNANNNNKGKGHWRGVAAPALADTGVPGIMCRFPA
jgi:hypothetical protein